jgi:hypothetical protein
MLSNACPNTENDFAIHLGKACSKKALSEHGGTTKFPGKFIVERWILGAKAMSS